MHFSSALDEAAAALPCIRAEPAQDSSRSLVAACSEGDICEWSADMRCERLLDEGHVSVHERRERVFFLWLARDGQRISKTIIAMGGYESISGNFIRIDSNGDSEGNFTAHALKPYNYTKVIQEGRYISQ